MNTHNLFQKISFHTAIILAAGVLFAACPQPNNPSGGAQTGSIVEDVKAQKKILCLEIAHEPDKKAYLMGESLDVSGLIVSAVYDDASAEITNNYTISGNTFTAGAVSVTVDFSCRTVNHPPSGSGQPRINTDDPARGVTPLQSLRGC